MLEISDDIYKYLEKRRERLHKKQQTAYVRGKSRIVRELDTSMSYIDAVLQGEVEL